MDSENNSLGEIRNELEKIISQKSPRDEPSSSIPSISMDGITPESLEALDNTEAHKKTEFFSSTGAETLQTDVQKLQDDLQSSYDLLQKAGETFNSINFTRLPQRVNDLNLSATKSEINEILNETTLTDKLNKLTDVMGNKFDLQDGEFANIPELSTFFQTCNQLKHGLDSIKKHREDLTKIAERLTWATNIANTRSEEIKNALFKS